MSNRHVGLWRERGALAGADGAVQGRPEAIRFGDEWLTLETPGAGRARDGSRTLLAEHVRERNLHLVVQVGRRFEIEHPKVPVLHRRGRYLVIDAEPGAVAELAQAGCFGIEPLRGGDVVFEMARTAAAPREPRVDSLLQALSLDRMLERLESLVGLGTRESTTLQYRDAARLAVDALHASGCEVELTEIEVGDRRSCNVVAHRTGTGPSPRAVVIATAHLDSINQEQAGGPAPGADDNASGAVGVLELAAALADRSCRHDLRFLLFGGEEQGLFGSQAYVRALEDADRIRSVVNMDMIATTNATPAPTVLIEGGDVSRLLMTQLVTAAATYTDLRVETSLRYFNSDHVPFIDAGIPAVLLIEGADSSNDAVHSARDALETIDNRLWTSIVSLHAAVLAANADLVD